MLGTINAADVFASPALPVGEQNMFDEVPCRLIGVVRVGGTDGAGRLGQEGDYLLIRRYAPRTRSANVRRSAVVRAAFASS